MNEIKSGKLFRDTRLLLFYCFYVTAHRVRISEIWLLESKANTAGKGVTAQAVKRHKLFLFLIFAIFVLVKVLN